MNKTRRVLALVLCLCMALSVVPMYAFAAETTEGIAAQAATPLYDTSVSNGYFNVISADTYALAPGAVEHEMVLNNGDGNDRKVAHIFEVDPKNEDLEIMPGYYGIDKLNPDDLAGDKDIWTDKQLSQTVKYYENQLGYNVVGAMNTALAYDSNAPYGYMVWNGKVLGTPEIHKGSKTYLAIDWEGNVELRDMTTPLKGNEKTAIPANFGWLVKDGKLTTTKVERTSSDASRSMVGVKADGTLIFCLVDGRNGAISSGLSNYEMGEMMLALGCVNAFNGDGGGSSTFISKRAGETENTMRSIPSDGSERATINSVVLVSTAGATGIFNEALIDTDTNYIAPGASMAFSVIGLDTKKFIMDIPAEVEYRVAEADMGSIVDGVYTAGSVTGTATIQAVDNGEVVGTKTLSVVHPEAFSFDVAETVLPFGKSMNMNIVATYGADDWDVCVNGVYTYALSDNTAATINGDVLTATTDETAKGVEVTVTYTPDASKTGLMKVEYGKGSEIVFNFEDGDRSGFMGFEEARKWSVDNNISNTLVGSTPLDGQFSETLGSTTSVVTTADGGQVKNGKYALAWTLDNTNADFAGWSYNVLFNVGDGVVLRDVANGQNATSLGMWLYIPEGAPGLAFQSQLWAKTSATGALGCQQAHFTFVTNSGVRKNLNSCTEADIPESRWVYASIDLTGYYYCSTMDPEDSASNKRSPSFVRTYVKPLNPAVLTFYIDDITLDYSSAVDDRILPTITGVTYATQDTSVELENAAIIEGNSVTFSANVADNLGLDNSTGTILVDGVALKTTVSGKVMSADAVTLGAGAHTATFEIKDRLGNLAKVTRTFTIAGDAAFTLTGHNNTGKLAEYGSIYYADINVADIASLNSLTATVKLQTANTWEPQGMLVADGFSATYELNELSNSLTVTVTKTGTVGTGNTVVSLPIRLWTWDGVNSVTGAAITPEAQFKTGYCPIVDIDYNITYGKAELADGTSAIFGGNYNIDTMMNDNVNPWHYHDAELTVLNQAATCNENGFENRTYCETCMSVVDWGTVVEAKGHSYAVVDNQLICDCGEIMSSNGLVTVNGKIYFMIGNKLMTGWQNAKDKWCYADATTKEVKTGKFTVNKLTYTADENGLLIGGAWDVNFIGKRYSYGPAYYTRCWQTIDGEEYYFAEYTGYALTGYHNIPDNRNDPNDPVRWYHFAEDGKLIERMKLTGVVDTGNGLYYMEEGCVTFAGMVKVGDDYYCCADKTGLLLTGKHFVGSYTMANSKNPMEKGYYEFGEDGKMLQGIVVKEDGTYYYEMGKPMGAGWVKDGNDYYVFETDGKALVGRNWVGSYLTQISKDPYKSGNFIFAKDGKLANGVAETDDGWYYCVDGVGVAEGLVCIDGQYYFADANGKLATGRIWVGTYGSNGLLPRGYYEFGDDGRMLNGIVEKEDGLYYYENGQIADTGWLKVGDDYYVFTDGGKALTGKHWVGTYLTQTSRDPYMKGNFYFTEDGKLANGIVEIDGVSYYYDMGVAKHAGLICLDGTYYLAEAGGKLETGRVWVGTYGSNGLLPRGYYEFGENGAMLQGVVEKADGLYYYDLGNTKYMGLIKRDGEFYYANTDGKLEIGRVWVGSYACNGIVKPGYYEFGADGAMLNGFETLSDGIYYYDMGAAKYLGLKVIGSDLYYIEEGGKVMTGYVYVGTYASNSLIPKGYYTFDAEGKFVK